MNSELFTEVLNIEQAKENSSLFTGVDPNQIIRILGSSIGSGIINLVNVWQRVGPTFIVVDDSNYEYDIIKVNGIDSLEVNI